MGKVNANKMEAVKVPEFSSDFIIQSKTFKKTVKPIKIGESYQASIPDLVSRVELAYQDELASLDWKPTDKLKDEEVEEFVDLAKKDFGYAEEQALGSLLWNDFNIAKTVLELPQFVSASLQFSNEEKRRFGILIRKYGTNFHRLRLCFPNTPVSELVTFYYTKWKIEKKKRKAHLPGRMLTFDTESETSGSSSWCKGESEDRNAETEDEVNDKGNANSGSEADDEDMNESNSVATSQSQEDEKNVADKEDTDDKTAVALASQNEDRESAVQYPEELDMTMTFYQR